MHQSSEGRIHSGFTRRCGPSERQARVRRQVDANIVGVMIWNLEGLILEANEAFLDMLQYRRDEIVAGDVRWTDLTPPEGGHFVAWEQPKFMSLRELRRIGRTERCPQLGVSTLLERSKRQLLSAGFGHRSALETIVSAILPEHLPRIAGGVVIGPAIVTSPL